jgi:hypothetical protein
MNDSESRSSKAEPSSDPDSSSRIATDGERPHERWLDRLKLALGLKAPASIREDLAEALADDEVASAFTPEERAMLANILRLREVRVDDVMVPRADIDAVDIGISVGDLLVKFRESGHSRMPVFRETLDDPVGFVHIKDLMAYIAHVAAVTPDPEKKAKRRAHAEIDLRKVDLTKNLADQESRRSGARPQHPLRAAVDAGAGAACLDAGDAYAARARHRRVWRHRRRRLPRGRHRDGRRRHRG